MNRKAVGYDLLIGLLMTAPLIAVQYLAQQIAGLPFLPYEVFDWVTRILPGDLVTFGIDLMIDSMRLLGINVADTAKSAEQASAVLIFLVGGVVLCTLYFVVLRARGLSADLFSGLVAGALFGLPLIGISVVIGPSTAAPVLRVIWLAVLFVAWGAALAWAARGRTPMILASDAGAEQPREVERIGRRQFLITLGASSATVTVVGAGVGALLAANERRRQQQALEDSMAHLSEGGVRSSLPNANDPVVPAPGTRPEYTPIMDHYRVFIRTEPTEIEESEWILPITGMVDNPLMLSLDDLRDNYPSRDQFVTLSCISGRIATTLISTTQWTGVSLQDLLADAQVQGGARYLYITSGDGFYETVDLDLVNADERIMLCYAWDGNRLPVDHGFPLRIWIPDRYGMKQPKWITGIEVTDEYKEGYWVERNWDELAQVKATSVIDTVAVNAIIESDQQRLIPIGGIAFAGARGISRVQVRVDGAGWEDAQLRAPLSETTWVIWRYEWPFSEGDHTIEVRCAEGDATPQIEAVADARPSGATGIHSEEVNL